MGKILILPFLLAIMLVPVRVNAEDKGINFSDLPFPSAEEFVSDYIIDEITPHFVTYLSALGAIAAFRAFVGF